MLWSYSHQGFAVVYVPSVFRVKHAPRPVASSDPGIVFLNSLSQFKKVAVLDAADTAIFIQISVNGITKSTDSLCGCWLAVHELPVCC